MKGHKLNTGLVIQKAHNSNGFVFIRILEVIVEGHIPVL